MMHYSTQGRLAMSSENGRLLPPVKQVEEKYKTQIEFMGKFLGGDERVNEMPALTVMHTCQYIIISLFCVLTDDY